jgi:oligopeptidase B
MAEPSPLARRPEPPVAPRRPRILSHRGHDRTDDWYWLRERDNPEVEAYLRAENDYTTTALAHLEPLRTRLFEEIRGRVRETDVSAPVRKGEWEYYRRTREGLQYGVHCRRPAGTAGPLDPDAAPGTEPREQVVLDENVLAGDSPYFSLGGFALSPDGTRLAYSTDHTGAERYTLRIRDLTTGADLADVVPDTYYGLAWAADGATVFAIRPDATVRPYQVIRHRVGTDPAGDAVVFQEDDERYYVTIESSRTERLAVITSASKLTTEVWTIDARTPDAEPALVAARDEGVEYHVEHHVDRTGVERFFVLTNADGATNFQLMVTDVATPGREHWQPFVRSCATARRSASTTSTRSSTTSSSRSAWTGSPASRCTAWPTAKRIRWCFPTRCSRSGSDRTRSSTPNASASTTRRRSRRRRTSTTTSTVAP